MATEEGGWEKKVDKTLMWEQSEADTIAVKKTLQLKKGWQPLDRIISHLNVMFKKWTKNKGDWWKWSQKLKKYFICNMASLLSYYCQNPSGLCFLEQIRALVVYLYSHYVIRGFTARWMKIILTVDSNIHHSFSRTPHSITSCTLILDHVIRGSRSGDIHNTDGWTLRKDFRVTYFCPCYYWRRFSRSVAR